MLNLSSFGPRFLFRKKVNSWFPERRQSLLAPEYTSFTHWKLCHIHKRTEARPATINIIAADDYYGNLMPLIKLRVSFARNFRFATSTTQFNCSIRSNSLVTELSVTQHANTATVCRAIHAHQPRSPNGRSIVCQLAWSLLASPFRLRFFLSTFLDIFRLFSVRSCAYIFCMQYFLTLQVWVM